MLVAHVTFMLYECWSNKHVGSACNMHVVCKGHHITNRPNVS